VIVVLQGCVFLSLSLLFQAFFRQYNLFKHYVYIYTTNLTTNDQNVN
jgi:hypothetical protein